jgi:hypothetical protein
LSEFLTIEPAEALGDVSRSRRGRIIRLRAESLISRHLGTLDHCEHPLVQLLRQLPRHQLGEVLRHAKGKSKARTYWNAKPVNPNLVTP